MKKLTALFVFCVMLAGAILPLAVSADGAVLFTDDFQTENPANWLWDPPANLFYVENGRVEGWAECVVLQSNYLSELGGTRRFKECAWKVDACALEDGGRDSDSHYLGLWFADYLSPYGSEEADGQIVYEWGFNFESSQLELRANFDGELASFEPAEGYTRNEPVAVVSVPESEAPVMDDTGASVFSLGMRIVGGVFYGYLNDVKYLEFQTYRGTLTATQLGSPVLFVNKECHCTWDNLIVTTADYDLFNEGSALADDSAPADGGDDANEPEATEKVIETKVETKVVEDTDENGEIVTRIETEIVTEEVVRPAPDTGSAGGNQGGTSARTGDAAIVVIAVMIAAFGAAIAVKKISAK